MLSGKAAAATGHCQDELIDKAYVAALAAAFFPNTNEETV